MKSKHINVIVSFDVEKRAFLISLAESNDPALNDLNLKLFKVIEFKLSELMASGVDKAINLIGNNVLSTIERISEIKLGVLELNKSDLKNEIDYTDSMMEKRANQGDAKAQEYLGAKYFNDSIEQRNIALLDLAESWYKRASTNGSESASRFLKEAWPDLKERYRKLIQRDLDQSSGDQEKH